MIKPKKNPQVGPGNYTPGQLPKLPGTTPTPVATPTQTPQADSTLVNRINQKLKDQTGYVPSDNNKFTGVSLLDTIVEDTTRATVIGKMLKARGKTVGASKEAIKNLFLSEPELASIAAKAGNDYNKLISLLSEDFIPALGKGGGTGAFTGPSRNIYKYSDQDVDSLIKTVFQDKLMRVPTNEELVKYRAKVRPQLEQGTVSTTKMVKNAQGVMEQVTTQEAGPTKEAVATSIEEELKKMNPDEIDRTARIGFSSWLSQNVAGA